VTEVVQSCRAQWLRQVRLGEKSINLALVDAMSLITAKLGQAQSEKFEELEAVAEEPAVHIAAVLSCGAVLFHHVHDMRFNPSFLLLWFI